MEEDQTTDLLRNLNPYKPEDTTHTSFFIIPAGFEKLWRKVNVISVFKQGHNKPGSTGWSASLCFLGKPKANPLRSCFWAQEGEEGDQDQSSWAYQGLTMSSHPGCPRWQHDWMLLPWLWQGFWYFSLWHPCMSVLGCYSLDRQAASCVSSCLEHPTQRSVVNGMCLPTGQLSWLIPFIRAWRMKKQAPKSALRWHPALRCTQ